MKIFLLSFIASNMLFALNIQQTPTAIHEQILSNNKTILSFNQVIDPASKSIVGINVISALSAQKKLQSIFNDPFFKKELEEFDFDTNYLWYQNGSGVLISSEGYIITSASLVKDAQKITVYLDNKKYQANLINADFNKDLAIIKIQKDTPEAIKLAADNKILIGDLVFSINKDTSNNIQAFLGIISSNDNNKYIQADIRNNANNLGAALIDSTGALIGIKTSNNLFLSSNEIRKNLLKITNNKADSRILKNNYGITLKSSTENQQGVKIASVANNSPAQIAGLKTNDEIISINSQKTTNEKEFTSAMNNVKGKYLKIKFKRGKFINTAVIQKEDK